MKNCEICNAVFEPKTQKSRFCSKKCTYKFYDRKSIVEFECNNCHKKTTKRKRNIKAIPLCTTCTLIQAQQRIDHSGPNNHAWKGGGHNWQAGKLGRDKDGLSWKKQRLLAWEHDSYTCQDCGAKPAKRKVDVHHISPYRVSQSHALDNLISLCQKCHKKHDATQNALWNGKKFGGWTRYPNPKPSCKDCGNKRRKVNQEGRCLNCQRRNIDVPLAKNLRSQGKTLNEIAQALKVSKVMVFQWVKKDYQYETVIHRQLCRN